MTTDPGQLEVSGTDQQQMAGDSVAVAGWTMVSRITGFGRFIAIAAVLGPTFFGNLFEATNLLPNLAFELLTGPLIAAMLVPSLVRRIDAKDADGTAKLAGGFLGVLSVIFAVAVVILVAAGPLVLGLLTLLVPDASIRADQLSVGWPLLAMVMPQALLYAMAATGVAVQNSHNKFRLAAAAPAVENIGIMAVMAVSAAVYGFGVEVGEVSTGQLFLLGLGTTFSVGLHAALQWWGAWRTGVALVPRAGWRNPDVRRMVKLAAPSSGYAALNGARTIGLLVVAGSIPGGVIAFQLGRYFFNLPVAIGAKPVVTAQLPRLSRAFNDSDERRFLSTYRSGINLILFVAVPASLILVALAEPMARAAAYGEMASTLGVALAAVAIGTLAPGIVGESLYLAATSAAYSRGDARAPFLATLVRVVLTFVGMAFAVWIADGMMVLAILGLSVAVSDLLTGFGLHEVVQRAINVHRDPTPWRANLGVAVVAVGAGVAFAALVRALEIPGRFTEAALGSISVVVVYLLLQKVRHSPELDDLLAVFRRAERA